MKMKYNKAAQMSKQRRQELDQHESNIIIDAWLDDNVHKHEPEERE